MADERLLRIKLLAMDVDGVLTRGDVIYTSLGDEMKVFNILDGQGIVIGRRVGLLTALVTGRKSDALARRALELRIEAICQGCKNKGQALRDLREQFAVDRSEVAFIGDDVVDILAFRESGYRIAVRNAAEDLKAQADYVTEACGGAGAVREVIEMILRAQGTWSTAVDKYLQDLER